MGKFSRHALPAVPREGCIIQSICQLKPEVQSSVGILGTHKRLVPEHPLDTKIHGCASPLYKMIWYLHMTCIAPPVYLNHLSITSNTQYNGNAM